MSTAGFLFMLCLLRDCSLVKWLSLLQYCDWRKMYHLTQEQVGDMEDHAERELGGKQC